MTRSRASSPEKILRFQSKGIHAADAWVQVTTAAGVSADGTVIAGFGLSPRPKAFLFGVWMPFRVVLPAP